MTATALPPNHDQRSCRGPPTVVAALVLGLRLTRGGAAAALVALVGGCLADRAFLPDADIPCAAQADCPGGFVCRPRLGSCLPVDGLDEDLPRLTAGSVAPLRGRVGDVVTMTVVVDAELLEDPRSSAPFVLDEAATDRTTLSYVFTGALDAALREGMIDATVDLVDTAGNEANDVAVGSFELDLTAPALNGLPSCTLTAPEIDCIVSATELVSVATILARLQPRFDGPALPMEVPVDDPSRPDDDAASTFQAHLRLDGTEEHGLYDLVIQMQDRVGNPMLPTPAGAFQL